MAVKLLAENILKASDFLSATEQEGNYIGQPIPNSTNTGAFRLLSKGDENGDIADFSYSGTATSDGAAGGTTVLDALLAAYGDDYFIGGTVAITDFLQDTADYTLGGVDAARVAKTDANTITVTDLDNDEKAWVVIDKGAAHFDRDFEFHVDFKCTANGANDDTCAVWGLANVVDTFNDIDVANGDFLSVKWVESGGLNALQLAECNGGVITLDTLIPVVVGTQYYLRIVRDESVGAYGTLYCYIYSDASHETLVDTLVVILTEKQDFRYLYWMNSYEGGGGGAAWDGIISRLEIVKSETKTISDFDQATGTITIGAFTYQVNTGTTFTLTVAYATRDFRVELITSGDAGDATFKWSHDGGTTYLGRNDPDQVNWLAENTIITDAHATPGPIMGQASNGDLICVYRSTVGIDLAKIYKSTDNGLSWSLIETATNTHPRFFILFPSGRILICCATAMYYSNDNGDTWVYYYVGDAAGAKGGTLLNSQSIVMVTGTTTVYCRISNDGGTIWGDQIVIANDANDQSQPSVVQAANGDVVCVYRSDEDAANDYELKCKISGDGGATWGSVIAVLDHGGVDKNNPTLLKDVDGTLFCACQNDLADQQIVYVTSTDNGQTWSAMTVLKTKAGKDLDEPRLALIDGHQICCVYENATDGNIEFVRRGIWEVYVANACPCAIKAIEQKLICDVGIIWHGGAGEVGDGWQFEAQYDFAMDNIISDSPSKFWRSEQDNIACRIVIDIGTNERFLADGIGFFNCNVRTASFQANVADVWTAPLVNESISFDLVTGIVDHITGNAIEDDSLLANYDDHHFKTDAYYLRMTHGTDDGETWKILDNVGGYIFLDTTAAVGIAAADTFVIFQGWTAKAFTNRMPYRFLSIYISAQETAEGYYKIGFTPIGKTVTLDRRWTGGYGNPHVYNVDLLQTPQGGLIPIKHAERYREFDLTWPFSENTRKQLVALLDYLDRKNICLIPDDSTDNQGSDNCFIECYLVKLIGGLQQSGGFDKRLDIKLRFREIL